jgi:hypothetical protein
MDLKRKFDLNLHTRMLVAMDSIASTLVRSVKMDTNQVIKAVRSGNTMSNMGISVSVNSATPLNVVYSLFSKYRPAFVRHMKEAISGAISDFNKDLQEQQKMQSKD